MVGRLPCIKLAIVLEEEVGGGGGGTVVRLGSTARSIWPIGWKTTKRGGGRDVTSDEVCCCKG